MNDKKAQGISINVIVIAAIALLVLVILAAIFLLNMVEIPEDVDTFNTSAVEMVCGNEVCETDFENISNCPEDCEGVIPPPLFDNRYTPVLDEMVDISDNRSMFDMFDEFDKLLEAVNKPCPTCEPICPDCVCAQSYLVRETYTSHFQEVISSVCNERDYELDEWDCSDESEEGVKRLKNAGYLGWRDACGFYYNGTQANYDKARHCWGTDGKLLVEFTNCEIVHPRDYWRYKR